MKMPNLLLAAIVANFSQTQQIPSTLLSAAQAQPATSSTTPCSKPAPSQPHKQGWIERQARALACKKNPQLCNLPSSTDDALGTTPDGKPCPVSTTGGTAPATKPVPQTPAAAQSPTTGDKPTYVCPPKTVLIPNTAYCLTADHSTVDAIPLPPSLAAPSPAQKTPAQSTNNH